MIYKGDKSSRGFSEGIVARIFSYVW